MRSLITMITAVVVVIFLSGCKGYDASCGTQKQCSSCPFAKAAVECAGECDAKAAVPQADKNAEVGVIQSAALRTLLASGTTLALLDARTGKFDDGNRIPGAKNLAPDAAKEAVEGMLKDKGALIVTYCANLHCPASASLARNLRGLGYKNVLEYSEGIEGWVKDGNQVETVKK